MKIYKCDICGKEIAQTDRSAVLFDRLDMKHSGIFGRVLNNLDFCGECIRVGEEIDFKNELLEIWRRKVKSDAELAQRCL